MAAPRKVFRIEEMAAARLSRRTGAPASLAQQPAPGESPQTEALQSEALQSEALQAEACQAEIREALGALRAMMAATAPAVRPDGDGRRLDLDASHVTRIAQELDAVVSGTAQATQKILAAAEEIDQAADNLSATLKGRIEQDVALDIRDLVIRIFEACNFQDLIGQRITKVMATLTLIEDRVAGAIAEGKSPPPSVAEERPQYLHGPRLEFDRGHVTQAEIDAMFESS